MLALIAPTLRRDMHGANEARVDFYLPRAILLSMTTNTNGDAGETAAAKQKKQRSPSYPSDGLETCLKWARKIYDAEKRNATSTLLAVKHMGYSSLSGSARTGLAAMKKFGLITEEGGERVRVSDDAVKVLLDPNEESRLALLRVLAQKPEIIRELLTTHQDGLPSDESLKFTLVTDRGFGEDAAQIFIRALQETVRFARLNPGQYIPSSKEPKDPPVEQQTQQEPPAVPPAPALNIPQANQGAHLHVWSLGGGVTVELRSSAPLTPKHFKRLSKYVELAAEAEEEDTDPQE
jgi:hypothetical protein